MTDGLRVLQLPGWQNSGPAHWQSRWQVIHGDERVEQDDWFWPLRGDWMARLEEVLLADARPALLVAHSLGCHVVAAWAAHSMHTARVRGALLVAPPDIERADMPAPVSRWRPGPRTPLPFPSTLLYSSDDPFSAPAHAQALAAAWQATAVDLGPCGHVNGDSGLGDWPAGRAWLQRLASR